MMKKTKKYYFSVEGETEQSYLKWLQNTINSIPERKYNIKLDLKIEKDPLSRAKGITILEKTEIIHVFDKESEASIHQKQFYETLDRMKEAQNLGKKIKYQLYYQANSRKIYFLQTEWNKKLKRGLIFRIYKVELSKVIKNKKYEFLE